ncbi:uncharacterized protein LOC121422255 [Lytechinus variegatus]|uniref:uncharacterized protein LOC121422255 n=1 Tax=Lytechinus variegatus TaxID=7654 RepID=UPI001BB2B204|nr:uncharacterized protein LOC121422255 [Lytechinus variegatus]XP_041473102.1 uncharacterized protein LOC121422255 [Lytechinus variegatus]
MESEFTMGASLGEVDIKDFVLSAKDLIEHNHSQTTIPYRGPKEGHPDGSTKQEQQIERRRDQRHELLGNQRVSRLGTLSVGEWEPDKELVVVKSHKGKFWRTMGYMLQGQKYLYPEEGLFLLEVGSMELKYGGTPLSVQRAYNLLIPTYIPKEHYRVYCHLMRLGYITTRHIESDVTDYEYRLRMHQYRHTQNLAYHKVQGWFQQLGDDQPMNSIWPDSDSNGGSLSSITSQNWYKRNRMSAGNSNANTNSSNGREQSGCDSSEVGSAGEMSRAIKARQRNHKSPGKLSNVKKYKTCEKEEGLDEMKSLEHMSDINEQERCSKHTKVADDEENSGVSRDLKQSEEQDGETARAEKTCEFVEPMEPIDSPEKITKALKDTSDDSSVYSDGPVFPEEDTGKGSGFEDMSISLLDFHKRRLTASSEDGSKKHKKMKMSYTESDSSQGKGKFRLSSHLNVTPPLPPHSDKKACTLDDSGKDTRSDLDQESAKLDQNYRLSSKRFKQGLKQVKHKHHERSVSSDLGLSDTASETSVDLEEFLDMVVPMMQGAPKGPEINDQDIQAYLEYPHWNFDKIALPDIASSIKPAHLPFPSKELVPASIAAGRCMENVAMVEDKQLELTKLCNNNKMLLAKSKKIIDVLEIIGDRKDKNQDSKTTSDTAKEPDNWKEYKEKKHQEEQNLTELVNSPVGHLWSGTVKPLVKPCDAKSTGHLLNKLQVIQAANLTCEHSGQRFSPPIVDSKIVFDVFLPDKKYKKTNPGQPNFCVVVCSEEDPVPELAAQLDLLMKAAPVPLIWGVVDNADINFYTLNDIELPVDITIG